MFSRFAWLGIVLCAAVSLAGTLSYGSSIDFGSCAQITPAVVCPDTGKSQLVYSNGGLTVTATGFKNPVPPSTTNNGRINLYVKNSGPGSNENGLGTIIDTADHEITDMDFVNLDFSGLWAHGISSAMLTIESLQAGEAFILCQGNALGSMGGSCMPVQGGGSLTDIIPISWGATNNMFGIRGIQQPGFTPPVSGPDVLVQGITFNTPPAVPEPASLLLFGSGIVALALKKSRRDRKPIAVA